MIRPGGSVEQANLPVTSRICSELPRQMIKYCYIAPGLQLGSPSYPSLRYLVHWVVSPPQGIVSGRAFHHFGRQGYPTAIKNANLGNGVWFSRLSVLPLLIGSLISLVFHS